MSSSPWSGRSPGEGNENLLQCSRLENPKIVEPAGLQSMGSQRLVTTKQLSTEDQRTFKPALVTFHQLTPGCSNQNGDIGILRYFVSFNLQVSYSGDLGAEATLKEIRSVYDVQK